MLTDLDSDRAEKTAFEDQVRDTPNYFYWLHDNPFVFHVESAYPMLSTKVTVINETQDKGDKIFIENEGPYKRKVIIIAKCFTFQGKFGRCGVTCTLYSRRKDIHGQKINDSKSGWNDLYNNLQSIETKLSELHKHLQAVSPALRQEIDSLEEDNHRLDSASMTLAVAERRLKTEKESPCRQAS